MYLSFIIKTKDMTAQITILKESRKGAMLITDGEKVAWIMPKQRREDGSYTQGVVKALAEGQTVADYKAEQAAYLNPNAPIGEVVRETERAIAVKAYTSWYCHVREDQQERSELVWIPKSMIVDGTAPKWFLKKKLDELTCQGGSGFHFYHF